MYGAWAMPAWYKEWRYPIMMLQILAAVLIQAYGMPRRCRQRWLHAVMQGLTAVLCFFVVSLEYREGRFYCNFLVICFTMFLLAALATFAVYRVVPSTAVLAGANGYLMQEMAGAFKTTLRLVFPALVDVAYDPLGVLLLDALSYGAGYFLFWFFLRKKVRLTDDLRNNNKLFVAVLALLICIGMSSITRGHDALTVDVFPGLADNMYLIGSGALLIALQLGLAGQLKALHDVDTMKEVVRAQSLQYKASKETVSLLNEKYHDFKQMIGALQGKVTAEELDRLDKSVSVYGAYVRTGSEVLDVLLTEKRVFCEKNGIRITTMVNGTDFDFMETLDLYSLFSNALTNAIEAVSGLPEGVERFISLSVSRSGQMILIHMENPCAENIVFRDGLPVTSRDREYHGFGMKSMERVAEKYCGTLAASHKEGRFLLDILLIDPKEGTEGETMAR